MTDPLLHNTENSLRHSNFELDGSVGIDVTSRKLNILRLKDRPIAACQWQRYIEQKVGFVLPDDQFQWLLNAVEQTAAEHALSLSELWNAVQTDMQLNQHLLDTVLIPESRFFRHKPSIEFVTALARQYDNQSLQSNAKDCFESSVADGSNKNNHPFRIWSVGCATGQEVWSLAMSLAAENIENCKILGTDASQQALTKARKGEYDQRQQQLIPLTYRYFMQPLTFNEHKDRQAGYQNQTSSNDQKTSKPAPNSSVSNQTPISWQVVPKLHERVDFVWHNIFTKNLVTVHLQQVILCQNMLIYFRQFDQRDILTRLAAQCVLGGHIILAPGEALFWRPSNMRRITHSKVNAWQKISA